MKKILLFLLPIALNGASDELYGRFRPIQSPVSTVSSDERIRSISPDRLAITSPKKIQEQLGKYRNLLQYSLEDVWAVNRDELLQRAYDETAPFFSDRYPSWFLDSANLVKDYRKAVRYKDIAGVLMYGEQLGNNALIGTTRYFKDVYSATPVRWQPIEKAAYIIKNLGEFSEDTPLLRKVRLQAADMIKKECESSVGAWSRQAENYRRMILYGDFEQIPKLDRVNNKLAICKQVMP